MNVRVNDSLCDVLSISTNLSFHLEILRTTTMSKENLIDDETHEVNIFNPNLVNSSTQTVIRVYPFVIEGVTQFADIKSDKKIQTVLTVKQNLESNKFYTLLRYTPFQDIKEDSVRVLDIPRFRKLQFVSNSVPQNAEEKAAEFSMIDDDGVGYICSDVLQRLQNRTPKAYKDAEAQTDVRARPHILDSVSVASIFIDGSTLTIPSPCCRRKSM